MRPKRLLLGLALATALAPSLWVRSELPKVKPSPLGVIAQVAHGAAQAGPFTLVGAWEIEGRGPLFGGFSTLVPLPGDRFLAGTDGGQKLIFTRPDRAGPPPILSAFGSKVDADKLLFDLESLTRDPVSGELWGGYEASNSIRRFGADLLPQGQVAPAAMADWGANSGPEAFARLADGRFLAIEERSTGWNSEIHRALVFAGDPVEGAEPEALTVAVPGGYRPVDMLAAPDGKVLVLLRDFALGLPPTFSTAIAVLEPDTIAPGATVRLALLAELGEAFPADNYEGMALTEDVDGVHLWLVSDDNFMDYQHSYLLKLRWEDQSQRQRQKARE